MKSRELTIAVLLIGVTGCTVAPKSVESSQASYDGNRLDSGVREMVTEGLRISEKARVRYNALLKMYGRDCKPPLTVLDYGLVAQPDGTYLMTREAAQDFDFMARLERAGLAPLNP